MSMNDSSRAEPVWIDDEVLSCAGTDLIAVFDGRSQTLESTSRRFVVVKSRHMIDWYARHFVEGPPGRVLEIGIFKGGSVALFEELWHPARLVAVDIEPRPVAALAEYVERIGAGDRVRPLYGIDQGDHDALRAVLQTNFDGEPVDLIVDDGCHYLDESRTAFNSTFPYLRAGGTYVIEDWGWAHWPGVWQQNGGPWRDKPAMTTLAFELVMLAASRPDVVESVETTQELIVVRKGPAVVTAGAFDLSTSYLTAGRLFVEAGFPRTPRDACRLVRHVGSTYTRGLSRTIEERGRGLRGRARRWLGRS
ncbi:MAG TPA: class I SAM-dependent methyltransferase [Thermoleophilia bacterium]|nr:class I SAM-dependent methyltransferase [Thermoleophilia bacterium]